MLKTTHLRFEARASRPVVFRHRCFGGVHLRNSLAQALTEQCLRLAEGNLPEAKHIADCIPCQLLAPRHTKRAYSVIPPLGRQEIPAGETFSFGLTLYGKAGLAASSVLIQAVKASARKGIGEVQGIFEISQIVNFNPITREARPLHYSRPSLQTEIVTYSGYVHDSDYLTLRFLSPIWLRHNGRNVPIPDFSIFFRRLLQRLDELVVQYGDGGHRPIEEVRRLWHLADRVALAGGQTEIVGVNIPSSRTGRAVRVLGIVGHARYYSPAGWGDLLPVLLAGQLIQTGKATSKGNGVFLVEGTSDYWAEMIGFTGPALCCQEQIAI